jgi:predicted XRE-type DNA-binding protein
MKILTTDLSYIPLYDKILTVPGLDGERGATMNGRVKVEQSSGNIFTDLGFPTAEAESLMLRSQLMSEVREMARGMTRAKAAKCFGITQPRLNDLLRGRIDGFSLDALVKMIAFAGLRVQLRVGHPPATRKTAKRIPEPDARPRPRPRPITGCGA